MKTEIVLREYQADSITNARKSLVAGNRKPLIQLATGGGKTIIALEIIKGALAKGGKVLFLAPRRELIYQAHLKFTEAGIQAGMIMAGESLRYAPVQVASFDTVNARYMRRGNDLPPATLVIVDEAHLSIAPSRLKILNWYADSGAIVLGLTATPARGDGKGLGKFYDDLISGWPIKRLTEAGYLSPVKYYAHKAPDLSNVKKGAHGDYVEKQLAEVMDNGELVGDIVTNWKRIAFNKSTVVFCSSQKHSRHVCEQFNRAGITAEYIDANTDEDERKGILQRVTNGQTTVLCNVYIASYGLDIPSLECAVIARPTKSLVLYLQTVGRVLRPFQGKDHAIVIDHAGVITEHGFVDSELSWSLDDETNVKDSKNQLKRERKEPKEITCGDCGSVFVSSRSCTTCGYEMLPPTEAIPTYAADLVEVEVIESKAWNRKTDWSTKTQFYSELLGYSDNKGYSRGWCAHQYRARSGVWPNDKRLKLAIPSQPSPELLGWIQHQAIKNNYSKVAV